ncbi:hypothetical protein DSC45_12160 [Streptomyces sp. YIM 130001]|uniref:hypothetical protein n=1 Tax=Streptomyces sp. YIM 130001 TaxID=2259644 RepID=UPI000EC94052|nr:hypothetical protein [Streptomyces sp. YIM 130001]RII17646.1 hypothetical protein DSC45_12160 [Streptomyces sp. YIM 130001]
MKTPHRPSSIRSRRSRIAAVTVAAGAALALAAPGIGHAVQEDGEGVGVRAKLSHSQATAKFESAGITWSSSGGCSDRNKPNCTSFDQVNSATVDGVITLKSASGCGIRLTGGTETGHADGTYSHWNGYKVDFGLSECLNNYIQGTFTSIGGSKWQSGSGNIYYKEGNHWDVTYHNCGGCIAAEQAAG